MITKHNKLLVHAVFILSLFTGWNFITQDTANAKTNDQKREFIAVDIFLDENGILKKGPSSIENISEIWEEVFVYLNLHIDRGIAPTEYADPSKEKTTDFLLNVTTEEARDSAEVNCYQGRTGRLEMLDDMEYYIETRHQGKIVKTSISAGGRTIYPYNDVFCAADKSDNNKAVFKLKGYFFLHRNDIEGGIHIELRPIELTTEEAVILPAKFKKAKE